MLRLVLLFLNGIIAAFGTDTLAAFGLVNRVSGIRMLPAMGIGAALTTVVGQNIGRGQIRVPDSPLGISHDPRRYSNAYDTLVSVRLSDPELFMPAERTSPVMVLALHFCCTRF